VKSDPADIKNETLASIIDKSGFVFPLIIMAALSMAFLIFYVRSMSSGYSNQILHVDETLRTRAIADSALSEVLAKVRLKPYNERFFSPSPYQAMNVSLLDGSYDVFVCDTPQKPNCADILIMAKYNRAKSLYFWRYKFETTLLDPWGKMYPIVFSPLKPELSEYNPAVVDYVNSIINERKKNRQTAISKGEKLKGQRSLSQHIAVLNGPVDDKIDDAVDPLAITPPVIPLENPPKPEPTLIYSEDFETCSVGAYPPGWKTIFGGIGISIADDNAAGGKKSARLVGRTDFSRVERLPVDIQNNITFEADLMFKAPNTGGSIGMNYSTTGNTFALNSIVFNTNGNIIFHGPTDTNLSKWNPTTWYNVKCEMDFLSNSAKVYLNGTLISENVPIFSKTFTYPQENLSGILKDFCVLTNNFSSTEAGVSMNVMYVDNIKISQ